MSKQMEDNRWPEEVLECMHPRMRKNGSFMNDGNPGCNGKLLEHQWTNTEEWSPGTGKCQLC